MYPMLTPDVFSGALEVVCYLGAIVTAVISCLTSLRF
jgi:hypothetical protein